MPDTCITRRENPFNLDNAEDTEDELGHMTDKPMKNGRNFVYSGFVHDMVDVIFMFPSPEYLMDFLCLLCVEIMVLPANWISTIVLQENYLVANDVK